MDCVKKPSDGMNVTIFYIKKVNAILCECRSQKQKHLFHQFSFQGGHFLGFSDHMYVLFLYKIICVSQKHLQRHYSLLKLLSLVLVFQD